MPIVNGTGQKHQRSWVTAYRRYLVASALGHAVWEVLQLPLYTIWSTGTPGEITFAVLHCTVGDILIGAVTISIALAFFAADDWPQNGAHQVLIALLVFGIIYTTYSEWLNVIVRGRWAYSNLMPILPGTGVGLSPLIQWLVVPLCAMRISLGRGSSA
jgi:hypothetical protein